jgi:hypothetical protein
MAAETETNTLQKVDSLTDNKDGGIKTKRRPSSMAADVNRIEDLGKLSVLIMAQMRGRMRGEGGADMTTEKEGKKIEIAIETQKLNWYVHVIFPRCRRDPLPCRRQLVVVRTHPDSYNGSEHR